MTGGNEATERNEEREKKQIGARVRGLRLQKGLTQSALAGGHVTRNMLSLIENGAAYPSVQTILYLAHRLEVPVGAFFLSDSEEEGRLRSTAMDEVKVAFRESKWERCLELCAERSLPLDDELAMICAVSSLRLAICKMEQYALSGASLSLVRAAEYARKTIYLDSTFSQSVKYYDTLLQYLNETEIPPSLIDLSSASAYVPSDMVLYFGILKLSQTSAALSLPFAGGTPYGKHIEAVMLLHEDRAARALKLLKELTADDGTPYFMRYRVLCHLETAANAAGDLRAAYVAAKKKLELLHKASESR